ncbi:hypothetical protein Zmor_025523 [Zophobas morio]|uniref:Cytochrome P450 n=1 Tax=Zophobas morio TaxID=2755281 RepID=A0AA38HTP1_9CUCU|nr:hypothetical protein Zmor_025523 [Zophobas morio]
MILIVVLIAVTSGLFLLNLNYKYWKKRGVPGPKPTFFVGNLADNFLVKKSLSDLYAEIYQKFQDSRLVGIFKANTPVLIIRDPELIKDITVKSFQHFHDNDLFLDKNIDPLLGRNPFFLKGEEWRSTRALLTPGFTSGKMKWVYPSLEEVSRDLVTYIDKHQETTSFKAKELCMRFTLNSVGACAFGLDAKCFEEDNPEFKQIGDRFLVPEGFQAVKAFLIRMIPVLRKMVSFRITPKDVEEKLTNIVRQTLRYREDNNIVRNDFMHILYQMTKTNSDFKEVDATAHAAGFFVEGYETSSVVMHFLLYELAANRKVQLKLRQEIDKAFEENDDTLPYEELQKLVYLDAVFNEALRLHPPVGSLRKVCTKPYTYTPKEDEMIKSFVIEEGMIVILSLYGLHRDPKYFTDPDCFKPERFLDAKKDSFKYVFMPFGEGQRACLGQRFGSLQVKIGVAYIIRNFEISVNGKTQLPIKYDPVYILTLPKEPVWLDFKKIR